MTYFFGLLTLLPDANYIALCLVNFCQIKRATNWNHDLQDQSLLVTPNLHIYLITYTVHCFTNSMHKVFLFFPEKHYGCYKVGILFSVVIILLLLVGCVPVFYLTHNNNLILLILLVTLILIGIVTYAYFRWQHRRALQMRRSYEEQKMNLTRAVKKPDPKAQNPVRIMISVG